MRKEYFSTCCGAENVLMGPVGGDITWMDAEACPECHEPCGYVEDDTWTDGTPIKIDADGMIADVEFVKDTARELAAKVGQTALAVVLAIVAAVLIAAPWISE